MNNASETFAFTSFLILFAGFVAGIVWFINDQFKQQRHDMVGRLKHRDRRILRLEYFLKDKLGFDMTSDLPPGED